MPCAKGRYPCTRTTKLTKLDSDLWPQVEVPTLDESTENTANPMQCLSQVSKKGKLGKDGVLRMKPCSWWLSPLYGTLSKQSWSTRQLCLESIRWYPRTVSNRPCWNSAFNQDNTSSTKAFLAAIDLQKEMHFHRAPGAKIHGWILHWSRLRFPRIHFGRQVKYLWYSTKSLLLSKSVKTRGKTGFCYAGVETSPCLIHQCLALERLVVLLFKTTLQANVSPEPVVSHRR